MASSTFPVGAHSVEGTRLLRLADELSAVTEGLRDDAIEGDCPDHTFRDGLYVGGLRLAIRLIREAVGEQPACA